MPENPKSSPLHHGQETLRPSAAIEQSSPAVRRIPAESSAGEAREAGHLNVHQEDLLDSALRDTFPASDALQSASFG
jgi:hypothetical protein